MRLIYYFHYARRPTTDEAKFENIKSSKKSNHFFPVFRFFHNCFRPAKISTGTAGLP